MRIEMNSKLSFFLFLFFSFSTSYSQNTTFQLWLDYNQKNKLNEKWSIISDYGIRSDFNGWVRYHARAAAVFKPKKIVEYQAGLALFYLTDFNSGNFLEIRPWQGVLISAPSFARFFVKNYFRLEERFNRDLNSASSNFVLKLRYKLILQVPINNTSIVAKTFYVPLSFEAFFNLAIEEQPINNDRYRFELGLAYRITEKSNIPLLYTLQSVYFNENNYIDFGEGFKSIDNIIRISFIQKFGAF